jgi:NO-binding membrane sensor protein with MHYT domain
MGWAVRADRPALRDDHYSPDMCDHRRAGVAGEELMLTIHEFGFGATVPALAAIFATAGNLLGLLLVTKARKLRGRPHRRLIAYATVTVAVVGLWLPHFLVLLDLRVPTASVRFDLGWAVVSLALVVAGTVPALGQLGRPSPAPGRIVASGVLIGLSAAGMHFSALAGVHVPGVLATSPGRAVLIALGAAGCAVLAASASVLVRSIRQIVLAAAVVGLVSCAAQYAAVAAVTLSRAADPDELTGLAAVQLLPLTVVGGFAVLVTAGYFTLGNATRRALLAIPSPDLRSDTSNIMIELANRMAARHLQTIDAIRAPEPPLTNPARPAQLADGRAGAAIAGRVAVASQTVVRRTVASRPAASKPAASQPAASQPAASQPAASQPVARRVWPAVEHGDPLAPDTVSSGPRRVAPVGPRPRPSVRPDWSVVPTWGDAAPTQALRAVRGRRGQPPAAAQSGAVPPCEPH